MKLNKQKQNAKKKMLLIDSFFLQNQETMKGFSQQLKVTGGRIDCPPTPLVPTTDDSHSFQGLSNNESLLLSKIITAIFGDSKLRK